MARAVNRGDGVGLAATIGVFLLGGILANVIVFGLGWNDSAGGQHGRSLPPDWVIGAVWIGLFAAMACARWLLVRAGPDARVARWALDALVIECIAYVFFAIAPALRPLALAGNILTIALALWAALWAARTSRLSAALIIPVAIWVTVATTLIVMEE